MKKIRRLFLLLCLITAGAQSAWAELVHQQETVTINNQTYELSYSFSSYTDIGSHHAYLIDISGTNEEVVIPAKITNGGITYTVEGVGALIENNSMKTLRFQGSVIHMNIMSVLDSSKVLRFRQLNSHLTYLIGIKMVHVYFAPT